MKVVIVGPSEAFKSGISTFAGRLAEAFAVEGHETHYVPIRKLLPKFLFPGKERAPSAATSPLAYQLGPAVDYNDPRTILEARRFIREGGFDVVVLQWWTAAAAHMLLPIARAARRSGARVILDVHEVRDTIEDRNPVLKRYSQRAFHALAKVSTSIVTHAESEAARARIEVPSFAAKVRVVPHPAYDHYGPRMEARDARAKLGLNGDTVFLSFGLVRDYKGVADLVRALEFLDPQVREHARVLIVGEVWDKAELESVLAESPHRDRVTLIDRYVADAEVSQYFSAADVVAIPYRRAAQSGVLQIALSYNLPVVVSRVGGLPEAVAGYPHKALCDPEDPASLARALTEVSQLRSTDPVRNFTWRDAVHALTEP